ncbi:MAG: GAF domain-containing protein [Tunicatimonas sp.]
MKKNSFSIGTKIFGGFIALIFIFSLNAVISILTINNTNQAIEETAQVSNPSAKALEDLMDLIVNSKMLITNWVYLPNNQQDKDALKELQNFQYPALKNQISALTAHWKEPEEKQQLDSIFVSFEQLIGIQKEIMASLVSFQDYEDPMVKLFAENRIEDEVLPHVSSLEARLSAISDVKRQEAEAAQTIIIASSMNLRRLNLILGLITVALGLIIAFSLNRNITRPISYVKDTVVELSKGQLPEKNSQKTQKFSRDEVGEMAQAVDGLVSGLRATSGFAEDIGIGNYTAEFNPLSEQDVLGNALINMRDNLRRVSEEDQKRHWTTEGTALFGELLRQNSGSVKELTTTVLTKLIEHMHANQGGIFVVQEDETSDEPYMTLEACYAWDREKYIEQKIYRGEGLAGQAWLEKDTLYFTDVPEEYITIVSGLGEANPTSILIVPLMVNEEVFGVVEMASFETYQPHEIEFMKKIAESIAATIATARINSKTQKLLNESTEMTEQMQAQEEEMRQNMEELQATQEEMDRKQRAMQKREIRIRAVLDCAPEAYINVDAAGEVVLSNRQAVDKFGYEADRLEGLHVSKLFQDVNAIDMLDFLREHTGQPFVQTFQNQQEQAFSNEVLISTYDAQGSVGYVVRFADAQKVLQPESHQ